MSDSSGVSAANWVQNVTGRSVSALTVNDGTASTNAQSCTADKDRTSGGSVSSPEKAVRTESRKGPPVADGLPRRSFVASAPLRGRANAEIGGSAPAEAHAATQAQARVGMAIAAAVAARLPVAVAATATGWRW
mmetsp:Transcript_16090/g.32031  ORF Transcript_16090/g.32031 Transcript_16090/m.32031 type:complete len:134 (-) Transcript_16090:137-538(-)